MKTHHFLVLTFSLAGSASLFAQFAPQSAPPASPLRTSQQVDELLSPIALYPDPLIGVILPASTDWPDIQAADQFMRTYSSTAIDSQPWDESVKALAHYPEVMGWMDENLPWTQQLGATFVDQPAEVMSSIQRLRASARASGILVSTPQQQVVVQGQYISIVPAQQDMIYVPSYDPQIIYSSRGGPRPRGSISFGLGFATGSWLAYDFDWSRRSILIDRSRLASPRRDGRVPAPAPVVVGKAQREEWHPRGEIVARARSAAPRNAEVARPANFPSQRFNPPAAANVVPQRHEPPLTPTGRMPEPRAENSQRREISPAPAQPSPQYERERERERASESRPAPAAAPSANGPRVEEHRRENTPPPPVKPKVESRETEQERLRKAQDKKDDPNDEENRDRRP